MERRKKIQKSIRLQSVSCYGLNSWAPGLSGCKTKCLTEYKANKYSSHAYTYGEIRKIAFQSCMINILEISQICNLASLNQFEKIACWKFKSHILLCHSPINHIVVIKFCFSASSLLIDIFTNILAC